ncbi:MAG TPA: hypothetical protein VM165_03985, partial [Planctomycetaceae bacterium]|nr:hypothetical protein [Planctomycetaceae bacterium]
LLGRAKVRDGNRELATCVDAMAGCTSGRILYLAVSEGGIAGAGETLRRLPWDDAHAEGEEIVTRLDRDQFHALEVLPKDQWPGR